MPSEFILIRFNLNNETNFAELLSEIEELTALQDQRPKAKVRDERRDQNKVLPPT